MKGGTELLKCQQQSSFYIRVVRFDFKKRKFHNVKSCRETDEGRLKEKQMISIIINYRDNEWSSESTHVKSITVQHMRLIDWETY